MNNHINIITKEAETTVSVLPTIIVAVILSTCCIALIVYLFVKNNTDRVIKLLGILAIVGIPLELLSILVANIFFRVPTGQFKYTATLDENNMTIQEYKAFIEEYNPEIDANGVYHFTTNIDIENK